VKALVLALLVLVGCGHPYRTTAIASALVAGAATTCAIECGPGAGRDVTDGVVILESAAVAAAVSVVVGGFTSYVVNAEPMR
jgi:hypothetical protein